MDKQIFAVDCILTQYYAGTIYIQATSDEEAREIAQDILNNNQDAPEPAQIDWRATGEDVGLGSLEEIHGDQVEDDELLYTEQYEPTRYSDFKAGERTIRLTRQEKRIKALSEKIRSGSVIDNDDLIGIDKQALLTALLNNKSINPEQLVTLVMDNQS